jgi:hypothetical protein
MNRQFEWAGGVSRFLHYGLSRAYRIFSFDERNRFEIQPLYDIVDSKRAAQPQLKSSWVS